MSDGGQEFNALTVTCIALAWIYPLVVFWQYSLAALALFIVWRVYVRLRANQRAVMAALVQRADEQYGTDDPYVGVYGIFPPAVDLDNLRPAPIVNHEEPEPPWIRKD